MAQFVDSPKVSRLFSLDSLLDPLPPNETTVLWIKANPERGTPVDAPALRELYQAVDVALDGAARAGGEFVEWHRRHVAVVAHAFQLPHHILAQAYGLTPRRSRGYARHVRRIKAARRRGQVATIAT